MRFLRFFQNLVRRSRMERDLRDELASYASDLTRRKIAEGMDPEAAWRAAMVEIGGLEQLRESVRAERAGFALEANLWKPLQIAVRRLWREPGFTIVAMLTLALAIGANTAIFSIADYVLFRPLPFKDPDRVQILQMISHRDGRLYTMTPFQHLELINTHHSGLSEVAAMTSGRRILVTRDGLTEGIQTAEVTPNYFDILGVQAYRGRLFRPEDAGRASAVVTTYAGWMQRFGGDEGVIGRTVELGSSQVELLGVLPPDFLGPALFGRQAQVFRAVPFPESNAPGGAIFPIVRLEPGVSQEQANAETRALVAGLGAADSEKGNAHPVVNGVKEVLFPVGRRVMGLLLAASTLVLLIGCGNLGIALLVRCQRRVRETGVRAALGASRLQIVLPVLFESLIIGVLGALLAVGLTAALFDVLIRQVRPDTYGQLRVGVDLRVAMYSVVLGLAGGLIFAVAPAWRSAKLDVQALIQGREKGVVRRGRLGGPLILLQSALAVLLMVGAVRVGSSFIALLNQPLGFDPENVLFADFPNPNGVPYQSVIEALGRRPDVISAAATYQVPLDGRAPYSFVSKDGVGIQGAGTAPVLPGFFETAGMSLKQGRLLTWDDVRDGGQAAVLSESAARLIFGDQNPLGMTFETSGGPTFRVVGVIADTQRGSAAPAYVLPWGTQKPMELLVRTRGSGPTQLESIRREIATLVPGVPITIAWWTDQLSAIARYRDPRFQTLVLGTFGALALSLTALGIFGVSAFAMAVRTKEMGIRMALGAEGSSLVRMMVGQMLTPVALGLGVGLAASRWAGKLAETQFGLTAEPASGWMLAAAAGTVIGASLLAAYVPARKASRVDPVAVLRAE